MAIAFDSSSSGSLGSGNSLTVSHTCSGNNRILFVAVSIYKGSTGANDNLSALTYGGVAMIKIDDTVVSSVDSHLYLYYLVNPSTGANNIVATTGVTGEQINISAASYNNVVQSGIPDSSAKNATAGVVTSLTINTTTIKDNCWLVGAFYGGYGQTMSGGTGTTARAGTQLMIGDSNGVKTPPGSHSLTATCSSGTTGGVIASFPPKLLDSNFFAFF